MLATPRAIMATPAQSDFNEFFHPHALSHDKVAFMQQFEKMRASVRSCAYPSVLSICVVNKAGALYIEITFERGHAQTTADMHALSRYENPDGIYIVFEMGEQMKFEYR